MTALVERGSWRACRISPFHHTPPSPHTHTTARTMSTTTPTKGWSIDFAGKVVVVTVGPFSLSPSSL